MKEDYNNFKNIGLYIHIPFCKEKCKYCDFISYSKKESFMKEYIEALSKEIKRECMDKKIRSIYIGGGTPSYVPNKYWEILKETIDNLNKSKNLEFSIEANPGTVTEEKLKFFKEMGINRISFGLQAWQHHLLNKLGRIHNIEEFLYSYKLARKLGFDNINVDLMFGIPDQKLENWKETLEKIVELNPEHISCYSLIVEEGTPFYKLYEKGKLNLPNEDIERDMYRYAIEFLENKGYHQYEISNFSKEHRECIHNLIYWDLEEYIGCGLAAHSFLKGYRYSNVHNIEDYIKLINENKNIKINTYKNLTKDTMEEFMFMGLRKIKGINTEEFYKRFHKNIYEVYGDIIKKYINEGLIIEKHGNIFLSSIGIELSNSIMCDFILD
ncbi:oxygen-independent coproporphyrinogen III oxidase [Clostridium tetani]|uniref:Heme chaperone HemW n=1 Tax=Clostridium tetani (strain Massachusetts / E88) TaxID=212717 RepID=Q892Q7_CLOTE|nr:radical SAM family heme chaperone HemW [Clostridium tetani]AAO36537.1 oxygen-independent coproporphyrinogen III oxidase [Clostridium tetani E88]KGI39021.1 coproporphyrinogen III oxidase [Clostridium tetani]KGI43590.1 coproporphyrinogen III oxidase [Clostridium tetani]KHO31455.1 coproporphyrinogen III oxidase [Clostridium tetani]KIG20778.1 coproporphyrinogen III oxidase [Clostridium tetani]